jgi:hypothetical protein
MEEVTASEAASLNSGLIAQSSSPSSSSASGKKDVYVRVTDPQKVHTSGITKAQGYVTYVIETKSPEGRILKAVRRFNQFDWVRNQLRVEYPEFLTPPLPEKSLLDRFADEFVEYRRRELERFLRRVLENPILSESPSLKRFLTETEEEMERLVAAGTINPHAEDKKEEATTTRFLSMFSSVTEKVTNRVSELVTGEKSTPQDPTPWFESQTGYVNSLGGQLSIMQTRSEAHIIKTREMIATLADFGHAAALLASAEQEQDGELSKHWTKLSQILDQMSELAKEVAQTQTEVFEDAVKDYVRVVSAVKEILDVRTDALSKVALAQKEAQTKGDEESKKKETASIQEFKRISKRVKVELQSFRETKGHEMRDAMRALVKANMDYQLRIADLWKELLRDLEDAPK